MRPNIQTELSLNLSLWALNMEKVSIEIEMEMKALPTGTSGPSRQ